MKAFALEALRRLLFFSTPEAAALIGGVSEQAWRRWESGARSVPADVAGSMTMLADWRQSALDAAVRQVGAAPAGAAVALVWYSALEDWLSMAGREPVFWRPQQSAAAALSAEFPGRVQLVLFDAPAYAAWLAGRADDETARSAWAASQI